MESPKQNRKNFYPAIEKILGRELTVSEHEEVKKALLDYTESQTKAISELNEMVQRMGQQRKHLSRIAYNRAIKAEILEKDIAFLKEIYES